MALFGRDENLSLLEIKDDTRIFRRTEKIMVQTFRKVMSWKLQEIKRVYANQFIDLFELKGHFKLVFLVG